LGIAFTIYTLLGIIFYIVMGTKVLLDNTVSKRDIALMMVFFPHTTLIALVSVIAYFIYEEKK
jgi:uncharacterized membrane protein SirB2